MSSSESPDNLKLFSLPRYLAAVSRFYHTSRNKNTDATFWPSDFNIYGESFGIPKLEQEAERLARNDVFYSQYHPGREETSFGLREDYLEDAVSVGQFIEFGYDGEAGRFVREFTADDREILEEETDIVPLLD